MTRRPLAACLVALGVAATLGACAAEPDAPASSTEAAAAAERPPNIVFFLVDDMGWRDVGVFGSTFYETPHIDALAEQGVRFTNAYAATHVCSPTRASLLTGKYPARLRLTDWLPGRREHAFERLLSAEKLAALPLDEVTLAEAFREHGYSTAIFGKWHLGGGEAGPLNQGFDVQKPDFPGSTPRGGYFPPYLMAGLVAEGEEDEYLTDRLTDFAVEFIEESQDGPFFLYLSHFAVHDPIEGRPDLVLGYREKATRLEPPAGPAFLLEGNPDDLEPLSRTQLNALLEQPSHQEHGVLPQDTVKIKQHQDNVEFAAMVTAVDDSLGRVQSTLDRLGLTGNTIVVFYSDNGGMSAANLGNPARKVPPDLLDVAYSTSNLPLRGAKGWLYEGGIRVPLIVRWPGAGQTGAVHDEPVISPDFYPTLLEMAGLPPRPDQHVDGMSFAAAVKGEDFERGPIYWHFPHYSNHGMQSPGGAIRDGAWKLLEYFENGTVQLFDLENDAGEQRDLATEQSARAAELRGRLRAWRESVSAAMPRSR
ncbi:MAG: sulfatase [Holophagales bacterium]|nr:sulfatase [Holophagales bacterium]MYD21555.1 sulfatase [Holophagales bacterium]MYI31777.1 sulfatase [Holophagales bacterium]